MHQWPRLEHVFRRQELLHVRHVALSVRLRLHGLLPRCPSAAHAAFTAARAATISSAAVTSPAVAVAFAARAITSAAVGTAVGAAVDAAATAATILPVELLQPMRQWPWLADVPRRQGLV